MDVFRLQNRVNKGEVIACLGVLFATFLFSFNTYAATQAEIDNAGSKAVAWLLDNQHHDGSWRSTPGSETATTAAALDALTDVNVRGYMYATAISWLGNARTVSTDSLVRQTIALNNAGVNVDEQISRIKSSRGYFDSYDLNWMSWGAYPAYPGSVPDTSMVLDALLFIQPSYPYFGNVLYFLINQRNTDNGWPDNKPYCFIFGEPSTCATTPSQVVPTAQAIIGLNDANTVLGTTAYQPYIDEGMVWLLAQQKADGSFGDETDGTAYETAQVYRAIVAVRGIDDPAAVSALDYLISQQQADGSWSGQAFQTALVLKILNLSTFTDTDSDGVPDAVETVLGTDPIVDDSRTYVEGNGEGIIGETIPYAYAATFNQSFSTTLTVTGTTGTNTGWRIVSGSLPAGLSLDSATGVISGSPTVAGTYNISYMADGSDVMLAQIIVEVDVLLNTSPVAVIDTASTDEDISIIIDMLSNDTDADGDILTVSSVTQAGSGASVLLNGDNTATYTPNINFNGGDSFNYTISDGAGGSATGVVLITVNAVNDNPIATVDVGNTQGITPVSIVVLENDTDVDGDTLSVTSVGQPTNGISVLNGDESVTYTSNTGFVGTDWFNYTITDGAGGTAGGVVIINVAAANNADGDINADGQLTITDVLQAQRHVTGLITLSAEAIARGDLYPTGGDGQITFSDILLIQKLVLATTPVINDADGDLLPDEWETVNGLNPNDSADALLDNDNDGLTNAQEYYYGANPGLSDTDGDGVNDGMEAAAGTSPVNILIYPVIITSVPDEMANVGQTYIYPLTANVAGVTYEIIDGPAGMSVVGTDVIWTPVAEDAGSTQSVTIHPVVAGYKYVDQSFTIQVQDLFADGDLNADGSVNISDVLIAEKIIMGLQTATGEQQIRGDLHPVGAPDGQLNISDLLLLQQAVLGGE